MARTTLTEKNAALVDALRIATTTISEQGAKIAALEQQIAAMKSPPPPTTLPNASIPNPSHEPETESEEPVSEFKALWNRAKRLTSVTGTSHFVRSGKVYRGYGRDAVAIV